MILPAPMLIDEGPVPFGKPGWIYELKFDGYRLMAGIEDCKVQLATKNGADATKWFPEITAGLASIPGGPHILDGEVCVLDELGRSDFNRLQARARRRKWVPGADPVVFCAFDLLAVDGQPLIALPVEERKRQLEQLLIPPPVSVLFVSHFDSDVDAPTLFAHAKALLLEGLVAKRLGSPYRPGVRSPDWVKVKRSGWQEGRKWKG